MEDLSSRDGKDYSTPEENPQEKRKSKAVPIILAVAGILLLAGLGTYLVVNRSPKNTGADAKKQSMPLEQRESTRALASQYMENGEYDQAISLLKAYIDENPTDAEALTLLQIAQSEKESLNAPESTDDILQTYNNFISTGDYATALRLIAATPEETLVSQGIDGPALISKARALENGRNLMNQGAYEQAASDLGIYLSQNPGDADAEKLLNQVNRLSTLASNSNIAGIDNSAGRTDLSASDDSSSNANGNSGATSAYAGTTGDLVSLNSSSASGNAGPSSSSYEQTPVVSSFTGMNSLPEGTTSRTENQSSAGNTSSRTGNTQPVANVNPRTNGSSSSPSTEGTASGTSANAATPVRNAGTSSSTPAANTGSAPVTRTVSTISTPGANSTSSSPRTEGSASGTSANAATPVRNAGTSSSTPAANTSSAPVTRTVSTIPSSQVPANTSGSQGRLSELLAQATASASDDNSIVSDGTRTSPEVLLRRYGRRAITRNEALAVGRDYINDRKYDEAINLMRELLTLNPNDEEARRLLEEAQDLKRRNGGNGGARTADQNLALARRWINQGNYDDAITLLNSILNKDPSNEEAGRLLKEALAARNGETPEAKRAREQAEQAAENERKAREEAERNAAINEARNALRNGNPEDAIAALERILAENPNDAQAKALLEQAENAKAQADRERQNNLNEAKSGIANGDYDDAINALNQILKNNPNDEEAKKLLAQATAAKRQEEKDRQDKLNQAKNLMNAGRYDEASAILNDLLKQNPNDAEVQKLLANIGAKKVEAARDRQNKLNAAEDSINSGNYDQAISALNQILRNNPNDAEARKLLEEANAKKEQARKDAAEKDRQNKLAQAKNNINNGNYDQAISALNQILRSNPNDAEARKLLEEANAKKEQARKDAAEKDRQNKLAQAKNNINNGNYDQAISALNQILRNNPNDAEARKLLEEANAKKEQARKDAAEKDRQNKLNAAKNNINSGNYDQAINALNQILRNNPNDAEARKLLEEANAKKEQARKDAAEKDRQNKLAQAKNNINSGNYDQAINTLNQILRSNPNDAEARKLLEEANAKKEQARKDAAEKDRQNKLAQARNSIDAGKYDQAISTLNGLLRTNPNDTEAGKLLEEAKAKKEAGDKAAAAAKERQNKLAQARNLINKEDYDGAMAIAQDLLKNNPNDTDARQLLEEAGRKKTQSAANKARQEKINRASALINSRNYDEAIALLNDVLKEDPNNTQAKNLLSQAQNKKAAAEKDRQNKLSQAKKYIDAGEYDKAQALLNGLIADNNGRDSDAQNLMNQASAKKAAAEQAAKEEEAKADAAKKKQQAEEAIAKGKAALQRGNSDEALSQFDQAKSLLPESERSYAGEKLGEMAQALYDGAQLPVNASSKSVLENAAAQYANAALAKDSNNAPSHYVLGMQAYGSKNYPKAEQELNQAAILDSKNGVYWYQLGRAQAMQRKYTQAAASFQNSINCDGTFAPAYYNLGYVQERNGNTTAALSSYKEACRVDAKYERAYIAAGRLMANAGDYKGAVDAFASAIKVNPSNAQTYQEQGSAYANLKDYKSAENSFRKALAYMDQSKPDAATYYNLSSVLSEQGKNAEGVTYAKMAYDNKASANKALQVNIIYNYGLLSERTGKKSQAVSLYEEALSLDSSHMKSKINLGALYLEQGDVESALTFLNSAYNQDKNNFEANNNLGNAYREKGDYAMAVTYYQNALKLVPTDNTVRENLAKVYASAGQYSNAKAAYEDVVAADERNWVAQLELAKIDMSLGNNAEAIERLEFLQLNNPSFMRTEVSSLLYSLR